MGAVYPGDIATFSTKRDLIDDVMAEHVNSLQSEVNAVEGTVGVNPQIETAYPGTRRVTYPSLTDRVHGLGNGDNIIVGSATQNQGLFVPRSPSPNSLNLIECQNFYMGYDPFRFGGNYGFILPEDGWWVIHLAMLWNPSGFSGTTVRKCSIQLDHTTRANTSIQTPGNSHCSMQAGFEGLLTKGTKVGAAAGLWLSGSNDAGMSVAITELTARFVRKPV